MAASGGGAAARSSGSRLRRRTAAKRRRGARAAAEGGEAPRSREAALRGEAEAVLAVPRPLPSCLPLPGSPTGL